MFGRQMIRRKARWTGVLLYGNARLRIKLHFLSNRDEASRTEDQNQVKPLPAVDGTVCIHIGVLPSAAFTAAI